MVAAMDKKEILLLAEKAAHLLQQKLATLIKI